MKIEIKGKVTSFTIVGRDEKTRVHLMFREERQSFVFVADSVTCFLDSRIEFAKQGKIYVATLAKRAKTYAVKGGAK